MAVHVTFYTCKQPPNVISKVFTNTSSVVEAELYDNTNILNPELKLAWDNNYATRFNMFYIQEFERYYFINDVIAEPGGAARVKGNIDVLYTYRNEIQASKVLITREFATPGYGLTYVKDNQYPIKADHDVQVYKLYGDNPFNLETADAGTSYNFVLNIMGRINAPD